MYKSKAIFCFSTTKYIIMVLFGCLKLHLVIQQSSKEIFLLTFFIILFIEFSLFSLLFYFQLTRQIKHLIWCLTKFPNSLKFVKLPRSLCSTLFPVFGNALSGVLPSQGYSVPLGTYLSDKTILSTLNESCKILNLQFLVRTLCQKWTIFLFQCCSGMGTLG